MIQTKAVLMRKETGFETTDCVVDKTVRLSGSEFDDFSRNLLRDWDFLRDNAIDTIFDQEGRCHCLLVVGENRREGILVNAEGWNYARYSAFIPFAEELLTVGQYPALTELNKNLVKVVDYIVENIGEDAYINSSGKLRTTINTEQLDGVFGGELNEPLFNTVIEMLGERPEIVDLERDGDELILYSEPERVVDISDPTVTRTDMYAFGYGWEGMIPLGKERAREYFDKGVEVFFLYEDGTEAAVGERAGIETFDGLFGAEDSAWDSEAPEQSFEVFILNRERYDKGEASGEWLKLPVLPGDLLGVFERIGVDRPSEGAFTITAIRVPEYIRDHVSKYDSFDELNMLASYMNSKEGFELETFQAILASGIVEVKSGTQALINILDCENFDGFEMIDANNAEELARYYHSENDEKPDDISFEDYGQYCIREEGGVFTEWGYLKFKYKELSPEYTGVIPDEYKISDMALHGLRLNKTDRGGKDEKPSVIEKIRASKPAPRKQKPKAPDKSDRKRRPEK